MSSDVPRGWVRASLRDAADVRLGRQRSPDKASGTNMVPYLRAANVRWHGLDLADVKSMQFEPHEVEVHRLQPGDVLVVEASGSRDEVGKAAIWNGELPLACLQNTLIRVRSRGPQPEFIRWRLHHDARRGALGGASQGIGIHHIGAERLAAWEIDLPPLNEQRRIVEKLDAIHERTRAARARLEPIPAMLDQLRQSILAAAFRGDLTKDWREAHPDVEPANVLLGRIRTERRRRWEEGLRAKGKNPKEATYNEPTPVETNALPELPEGWAWVRLPDLGELARGKSKHRPRNDERLFGDAMPFIQTGEVARSGGVIRSWSTMYSAFGVAQSRVFRRGTVCITIAANIADSGILDFDACFPDSVVGLVVDERLATPSFAENFIRLARADLARFAPATAQANINLEILGEVAVPLPPREEVDEISRRLVEVDRAVAAVATRTVSALSDVASAEASALAKAFRGELVAQDPKDEPATVLLAKLKTEQANAAAESRHRRPKTTRKRPTMSNTDKDSIKAAILKLKTDRFSFDELREQVSGDYDSLKSALFELLKERSPVVRQVFDKKAKAMQLERVRP